MLTFLIIHSSDWSYKDRPKQSGLFPVDLTAVGRMETFEFQQKVMGINTSVYVHSIGQPLY